MSTGETSYKISIEAESSSATTGLREVTQGIEELNTSATQSSDIFVSLEYDLDGLGDSASSTNSALSQMGTEASQLGNRSSSASTDVAKLQREVEKLRKELDAAKDAMQRTGSGARNMGEATNWANGDIVKSTRGILQPFADVQSMIGRVTMAVTMLKGAWDIGWEVGSFIRGLTEANAEATALKANLADVQKMLDYKRGLMTQAQAKGVDEAIQSGDKKLSSGDGLRDISSAQSDYMVALGKAQARKGFLLNMQSSIDQASDEASMSGDHDRFESLRHTFQQNENELKQLDDQISRLSEKVGQAAFKMRSAISDGVSETGAWERVNVDDFMNGGDAGARTETPGIPTMSGNTGMGLGDWTNINQQTPFTPAATPAPGAGTGSGTADALGGVKTSMEGLGESGQEAADAARGVQDATEQAAATQDETAQHLSATEAILQSFGAQTLANIQTLMGTCSSLAARTAAQQAQIASLNARVSDLAASI